LAFSLLLSMPRAPLNGHLPGVAAAAAAAGAASLLLLLPSVKAAPTGTLGAAGAAAGLLLRGTTGSIAAPLLCGPAGMLLRGFTFIHSPATVWMVAPAAAA
jgi:hypothetical protein